jgi:hypothetical protein
MNRWARAGATLGVLLAAYLIYAVAAVPLIEPSAPARPASEAGPADPETLITASNFPLAELFQPGDWELGNAKVLENEHAILLLEKYETLPDGRLRIWPCTVVFLPGDENDDPAERRRSAVFVRSPQGAILQFDQPFDLASAKVGRLVGGQMLGRVSIDSDQKDPGPADDLHVAAQDLFLREDQVSSTQPVEFRWGPNWGTGRELLIRLLPRPDGNKGRRGPNVGGVQSIEVRQNVRLYLELAGKGLFPGVTAEVGSQVQPAESTASAAAPVQVTCRGPFSFDCVHYVATFENRVDVLRKHPSGMLDELQNCDRLRVGFGPKAPPQDTAAPPATDGKSPIPPLKPLWMEAVGAPLVLKSPASGLDARCQTIDYQVENRTARLSGDRGIVLRQGTSVIEAPQLEVRPQGPGRLPELLVQGPGYLQASPENDPSRRIDASWESYLSVHEQEGEPVVSLVGGARFELVGLGMIRSNELHVWLERMERSELSPPATPMPLGGDWRPDRLRAVGVVELDSRQFTGRVNELQAWFILEPSSTVVATGIPQNGGPEQLPSEARGLIESLPEPAVALGPEELPEPRFGEQPGPMPLSDKHYEVSGQVLMVELSQHGKRLMPRRLSLDGNARFKMESLGVDAGRGLDVAGERITVRSAQPGAAEVGVEGSPARVEASAGLVLEGGFVGVNQSKNLVWVNGPGRMNVPVDRDLNGRPLAQPESLKVRWNGGMTFDGRLARLQQSVVAEHGFEWLGTELMEVTFTERIAFSGDAPNQPRIGHLDCRENVALERQEFNLAGEKTARQSLTARDLSIDQETGEFEAGGPAFASFVRQASGGRPAGLPGLPGRRQEPDSPIAEPSPPRIDSLEYLSVRCQTGIRGSFQSETLSFVDDVQTVYGPVVAWEDVVDPDRLGPRDMLLKSQLLHVHRSPDRTGDVRFIELEAEGEPTVEGAEFFSRASRMTYSQESDLLIIEGNGRKDAEFFQQTRSGQPRPSTKARKIWYWPKTGVMEINDFGGGQGRK